MDSGKNLTNKDCVHFELHRALSEVRAQKKIAVIVDNPRRDLRGSVLLAYQFAKRGAAVFLVPMYQQGYDLPLLAPDMVVLNYAREQNRGLLAGYRAAGTRVAVLDTEGGVLSESGLDSPSKWGASFRDSGLVNLVDYYCFWGRIVYDAFRQHSGMDESNIALTGCPRYDVCSQPWASRLAYPRSGFILINTNFSAINPAFTRSAVNEQRLFCEQGWDAGYVQELFSELAKVFPSYLDAIESIAVAEPARTVRVRPHPFENENVYKARFARIPNVIVDGKGDIFEAISGSDCVVHLNCGSSVDAARIGKTPISMEFLNSEVMRRHAPLPSRVSCHANSLDDLLSLVGDSSTRANRYDLEQARREIEPWYHLSDGRAAERVAEFLLSKEINTASEVCRSFSCALRAGRSNPTVQQILLGGLSLVAGTYVVSMMLSRLRRARRGKHFDLSTVRELIALYGDLDGGSKFQVTRLSSPLARQPLSSLSVRIV